MTNPNEVLRPDDLKMNGTVYDRVDGSYVERVLEVPTCSAGFPQPHWVFDGYPTHPDHLPDGINFDDIKRSPFGRTYRKFYGDPDGEVTIVNVRSD